MPGGFGTLDELFEALTLIQTKKISNFPIVVFGKEYWRHLSELLESMAKAQSISKEDLKLLLITDSIEEAIEYISKQSDEQLGLNRKPVKKFRILAE
jgi:predicted Rossmann-fold nucleotide-binding protein